MLFFNRLTALCLALTLLGPLIPLEARTRQGDKFLAQGRGHEAKKEWDVALEFYEKALAEDPTDSVYQMAAQKARFQASQTHVDRGTKLRSAGQLGEALLQFQRAYAIYPASAVAMQEIARTQEMIQRERKRVQQTGKEAPAEVRGLTPSDEARKETQDRIRRMQPVPELKPLNPDAVKNLQINGQPVRTVFETIGKIAGITVLWDPDYQPPQRNLINVNFVDTTTLEEALDYVAVITKSFWKPLSPNAIFVTNDNVQKRRDFADMVTKTFYLQNIVTPQELQEIVNAVRTISELQRVVAYGAQNAVIVRGEADQVALAEKMLLDLDKPKAEVVVDILVMEASSIFSRQLAAAIASTGLNVPVLFTPRPGTRTPRDNSNNDNNDDNNNNNNNNNNSTLPDSLIPLSNLGRLSSADFSITLPSAVLQAVLSDTKTKIVQAPQLRSVDNVKAILKIGERQPTATGSFQPGIGGVGINPLVNTQFTYIDVGVNVEIVPRVHDNGDVSMSVILDISTVAGSVNLGGIEQPIIGQRKVEHGVRIRDGEVSLLGGLINTQESKQLTGIPGLHRIPGLGKLFSGESVDRQRGELMIVLVPHVIRRQDITPENLKGIYVGNAAAVKLNLGPKPAEPAPAQPPAPGTATPPRAAAPTTPPATAPPATAPPATAPPATAPAPGATPPRVFFSPAQVETTQGSPVTVTLSVEGATDLHSAPMQIQFDPKMLNMSVVRGGLLSSDGQQPVFSIQNDAGVATVQLNRQPGAPGVSGAGALVTLTFQATARGTTTVTIPNLTLRNAQGTVLTTVSPQLGVTIK